MGSICYFNCRVSYRKIYHMTHTIIFLTDFFPKLTFQRNLHTILLTEPTKGRRLRESDQIRIQITSNQTHLTVLLRRESRPKWHEALSCVFQCSCLES